MLRLMVLASVFSAAWLPPHGAQADQSRLKSIVLEYLHASKDGSQHKVVQRIIFNSFGHVRTKLKASSSDLDYLDGLGVSKTAGAQILSPRELTALWADAKEPPIQILRGEIEPDEINKNSQIIRSTVYIGDLPALAGIEYTKNSFRITTTTRLIDYGVIPNLHSYILTYALILDALQNKKPSHVIFTLINAASVIYSRLEEGAWTTEEIRQIRVTIAKIASIS